MSFRLQQRALLTHSGLAEARRELLSARSERAKARLDCSAIRGRSQ